MNERSKCSRREFLKAGAGVGATLAGIDLTACSFSHGGTLLKRQSPPSGKPKVLVIGAGLSGLSAARRLQDEGTCEVLVLEARHRSGGRVWTDRGLSGIPLDIDSGPRNRRGLSM